MHSNSIARASAPVRSTWRAVATACFAIVFASYALAQAPAAGGNAAPPASTEQLDKLVGPIALYPDDLVAIILPAATNPLQLVQADRFLDKRKSDPKLAVDDKWDDAVKALVNYPDVVKTMSGDLDWTAALGEAVVADQGAVLEAIQVFRRKAQALGNLKTDPKQVVVVEKEVIKIVPANPEVIYVPQYNPTTVVVTAGYPWGYWPTPYPVYYYPYPPGAAFATGLVWGAAIGAAWNGGRYATHYGSNANININTGNINTGNINRAGGATTLPAQGSSTAWKSNKTAGQVSSTVGRTTSTARVGDAAAGAGAARPSTQPAGGGAAGQSAAARTGSASASQRAGSASASQRAGSASASPRDSFGGASGGGAMSGYGSGRQTQMDSSRGASSRSSMSGGASRSTPSGGARGGGGGGGRGGGRR